MSLTQRLTEAPRRKGPACDMVHVLAALSKTDRAALDTAMADRSWTAKDIAAALVAEGHRIGFSTVQRHRRGDCSCVPQ